MSANVETMFYVREKPWHGLGVRVEEAPTSIDALVLAGLDWQVTQKNVYTQDGYLIPGYKANIRSTDDSALGIVSDKYKVVQNEDAFQFTDDLLGAGVTYETAGALQGGRKVWMLARMPHRYIIAGDEIAPYLVVINSHDGSSGIKVAITPIRVVCQNTLNLALNSAKRVWTTKHTENVMSRVHEAQETLGLAERYMTQLGRGIEVLSQIRLTDKKVMEFLNFRHTSYIDLPEKAADLLRQYDETCEQLEAITEQKQLAENLPKEMMGENEIGTAGDRVITWKSTFRESLDSKTLKAEHPALYKKHANTTTYRRFSIKAAA